jgi:hypothetical protein
MYIQTKTYTRTDGGDFFDLVAPMVTIHGKIVSYKKNYPGYLGMKIDLQNEGNVFVSINNWENKDACDGWEQELTTTLAHLQYKSAMDAFLIENNIVCNVTFEES